MNYVELKPDIARANGPNCFGCRIHKMDVMLSFGKSTDFTDVFLTAAKAQELHDELGRVLSSIPQRDSQP